MHPSRTAGLNLKRDFGVQSTVRNFRSFVRFGPSITCSIVLSCVVALEHTAPAVTLTLAESQLIETPNSRPDANDAGFFGWDTSANTVDVVIGANSPLVGGEYNQSNLAASVQVSLAVPESPGLNPANSTLVIEGSWKFKQPTDLDATSSQPTFDHFQISFTDSIGTNRESSKSFGLLGGDPRFISLGSSFKDCVFASPGTPCPFRIKVARPRVDSARKRIDTVYDYFEGDGENQLSADGGDIVLSLASFELLPMVRGVHLFYNNSSLDNNGAAVTASDFAAIATDKAPFRFFQTASTANVSGYSSGLNGLFIDFDELPGDGEGIDASDFAFATGVSNLPDTWSNAAAPESLGVLPDQGESGADRVFVTFSDGAIRDTYLRITVKANEDTGLVVDEDYFYGIAPGETGASFVSGRVGVDAADLQSIASMVTPLALVGTEPATQPNDLNRDRTVNAFDLQAVAVNLNFGVMPYITPQIAGSAATVPEPGTSVLLAMMAAIVIWRHVVKTMQSEVSSRIG